MVLTPRGRGWASGTGAAITIRLPVVNKPEITRAAVRRQSHRREHGREGKQGAPLQCSSRPERARLAHNGGERQWAEVAPIERVGAVRVEKEDLIRPEHPQPCQTGRGRPRQPCLSASLNGTSSTMIVTPVRQTRCPDDAATRFRSGTPRGR